MPRQGLGLAGLILNYSITAIEEIVTDEDGSQRLSGPQGPSTVVPASWFAHQPLTAPPPPPRSPPPAPLCAPSSKPLTYLPTHGQWWHMILWVGDACRSVCSV